VIKDLVVNLVGRGPQDVAAEYAISVAKAFDAEVTGIAFVYDPIIPDAGFGGIPADVIEIQRAEQAKAAQDAIARFEALAKQAGVRAQTRSIDASLGGAATEFGRIARRFDVSVVGQAQRQYGAAEELMIEGALFESGRPVIVVPHIQKQGLSLNHIVICWDGGRTAARAIGDAMPLLKRAKAIEVLVVAEARKHAQVTGARLSEHLARHGITVEIKRIARGEIGVEAAILSHVADAGADFVVMGGYGHSRLREFVLGGVTRSILTTMTVPVLMSH
jgi:nucleotide-binding universal stress UspA family protein